MQPRGSAGASRMGAAPQQKCPRCGAAVHEGEIICVRCGTNLLTGQKIAEESKTTPLRERRRWPLFVGLLLAAVVIGVLAWLLPDLLKSPVQKARELAQDGKKIEAAKILEQHLANHRDDAEALRLSGALHWEAQEYTEAATAFEDAFRADPKTIESVWAAIAALEKKPGDASRDRQARLVKALIEQHPDNADGWYLAALFQAESGELDSAIESLRTVLASNPDHKEARVQLGIALARKGAFEEAAAEFDAVQAQNAASPDVLLALAALDSLRGDEEQAMLRLNQAAESGQPLDDVSRIRVALSRMDEGDYAKAEELLRPAVQEVRRENEQAALFHGLCLNAIGQTAEATSRLMRVVDLGGQYSQEAATTLAAILLAQNNVSRARDLINTAVSIDRNAGTPNTPARRRAAAMTHTVEGRIFIAENQKDDALTAFQRAVEIDPDYGGAALELGLQYVQSGALAQGVGELNRYIGLAGARGDHKDIEMLIEQLQQAAGTPVPEAGPRQLPPPPPPPGNPPPDAAPEEASVEEPPAAEADVAAPAEAPAGDAAPVTEDKP